MGLESGTFVNDLNASNPVGGTDDINQGDDHIRLLKLTLRNTFPTATRAFYFPAAPAIKAEAYTIVATDQNSLILGNVTSGDFTITLPLGSTVFTGFEVTVAKWDSSENVLTVDGNGSETINGGANRSFRAQYISETYRWAGDEWKVVATYTDITALSIGEGLESDTDTLRVKLDGTSIGRGEDGIKRDEPHDRKTGDYVALLADNGKIIEMDKATAVTLTLTAAADLSEGWFIDVHNSGAGVLTIDGDSTELVDDEETIELVTGEGIRIVCDGTGFWTIGRQRSSLATPDFTSGEETVASDTLLTVAHSLASSPINVEVSLLCKVNDQGFLADESIQSGDLSYIAASDRGIMVSYDATNIYIAQGSNKQALNKSTFNSVPLTDSSWRYIIRAWL